MQGGLKDEFLKLFRNNKLLLTVLLIAIIVLIAIKIIEPSTTVVETAPKQEAVPVIGSKVSSVWRSMEEELEEELEKFLGNIKDSGKVQVMIRISKDESKIRAIDEDKTEVTTEEVDSTGVTRTTKEIRIVQKTVQESSSGGYETVWLEMKAPEIDGVIVVATGANNLKVKAMLIEAIGTYFNIPAYKISVMPGGK